MNRAPEIEQWRSTGLSGFKCWAPKVYAVFYWLADLVESALYPLLMEGGRSLLINPLHKLFPSRCWADIILWALDFFDDHDRLLGERGLGPCLGRECNWCARYDDKSIQQFPKELEIGASNEPDAGRG